MSPGQIRIIGGSMRGRKLKVPTLPYLRPTPNRVRETLFNWLGHRIVGAHCLDAFAGSGALGFEAISRGAAHVVMMDASSEVVQLLKQEAEIFKLTNIDIDIGRAPSQLKPPSVLFDIVFLDPPFQHDILLPTCFYLEENNFLADDAYIYLEAKATVVNNVLPPNWIMLKSKKAGDVAYHLVRREMKK